MRLLLVFLMLCAVMFTSALGQNQNNIEQIRIACVAPVYIIADDFNRDAYPDLAVACHSCNAIAVVPNAGAAGAQCNQFNNAFYWKLSDSPVALDSGMFLGSEPAGNNFPYAAVFPNIAFVTQFLPSAGRFSPLPPGGYFLGFTNGQITNLPSLLKDFVTLTHLVVGDFNNDGDADVALLDGVGLQIGIYLSGRGTLTPALPPEGGTITKPVLIPVSGVGINVTRARFLAAADFDRDGDLDLAVAAGGWVLFYRNDGGTNFALAQDLQGKPVQIRVGTNVTGLAVADFDRDGYLDVAAVDPDFGALAIIMNRGCWKMELRERIKKDGAPYFVSIIDCDRNGLPDLAIAERDADRVEIVLTQLTGTQPIGRPDPCTRSVPPTIDQIQFVKAFDIDISVAGGGKPVGLKPVGLAIADFDLNGIQDIAVVLNGAEGTTGGIPEVMVIYNPCCCQLCKNLGVTDQPKEPPCCPPAEEAERKCEEEGGTKKGP